MYKRTELITKCVKRMAMQKGKSKIKYHKWHTSKRFRHLLVEYHRQGLSICFCERFPSSFEF